MRREKTVSFEDRGNKLTFKIREMSATETEYWILRAIKVLGAAGVEFPSGADLTSAAKYALGHVKEILQNLNLAEVRELADDLLRACSRIVGKTEEQCTPETIDDYVQDVRTLFGLRMEAAKFCLGFFGDESPSESLRSPSIKLHSAQDCLITKT